jgi:DNA processing protein
MFTLKGKDLPEELGRLFDPPKQLFASSGVLPELMNRPRIGIVGSRKFTPYGRAVTSQLSGALARHGVVIVSGLALGIDSLAQQACISAGGQTVAVLPAGLDRIYPRTHTQLASKIIETGGLLLTEYPAGSEPYKVNFLARNRIIAALSEGLLIPEAAVRSGSLNTARVALELGIPVFAVPGPITNPTSEGTNNLIKAGAIPVTSVDDILNSMDWHIDKDEASELIAANEEERIILKLLKSGISDGHELLAGSKLDAAKFNQALTMLELHGQIRPLGANHWATA